MARSARIELKVATSHGAMAVEDTGGDGMPLVLVHGNSSCRDVFRKQMSSMLAETQRMIAVDLPGHGQSENAADPARSYTRPGLAEAIIELFGQLGLREVVVLGWSLGGHIGIELLARFPGIKGLVITGTPPVRHGGFADGFVGAPQLGLASRKDLSPDEIDDFARMMFGAPIEPFLREAIARADGRCRQQLFETARAGLGVDQRIAVESSPVPIAVINGEADPLIRLGYLDSIAYGNLWDGCCHRLPGAGHAPFWHAAGKFNVLLERFLADLRN